MLKTSKTVYWAGVMICGLTAGGMPGAAVGQCEAQESSKATATPESAFGDLFGNSVAISGNRVIVGAPHDDDAGDSSGSAYVFEFDGGWNQEQKLTTLDGNAGDKCGSSVAISGDVAVVGAPEDTPAGPLSGSAYIFRFDGNSWIQDQKLTASDMSPASFFGWSVAIEGDVALVGALNAGTLNKGAAYVFRYNGASWIQEQKLTASDGAPDEYKVSWARTR